MILFCIMVTFSCESFYNKLLLFYLPGNNVDAILIFFFVVISSVLRYQVAKFTLGNLSVISRSLFSFQNLFNCLVYQLDFEMFLYLLINICKLTWSFCVWLGGRRYNLWWRNSGDIDKGMCWRSIDTRRTFKSSFLSWLCQVNKVVLKFPF